MSWMQRIRNLRRRDRVDAEIDAELQSHIELAIEEAIHAGHKPADARREAMLRFGNPVAVRENTMGADAALSLDAVGRDLKFALRQIRRSPGSAATVVLTLALGIGAATAIFSAVDPILFEPLPYPHANRIVMLWGSFAGARAPLAFGNWRELTARSHTLEALAASEAWQPSLVGSSQPKRLDGQRVTANYFHVLGVAPSLGRDFRASEDAFNGPKVVILSDRLWRGDFGADPTIPGRQVKLDGDNYTVIGVMPLSFENVLAPAAQMWTPMQYDPRVLATDFDSWGWGNHLSLVGRLHAGISAAAARAEIDRIANNPIAQFPRPRWASMQPGLLVDVLQEDITRGVRPALLAVLGAVILLLGIAAVNVTNLLLARGAQRRGEFAMRITLGAGRARILRQLVIESLLLSGSGGALGLGVAATGVRLLRAFTPPGLPRANAIALSGEAFAFAAAITTIIGVMAGIVPALYASRGESPSAVQRNSGRTTRSHAGMQRALIVAEFALASILLAGAGLLLRSMEKLLAIAPGFRPDHLLTMQVQTSGHQFDNLPSNPSGGDQARWRFFAGALDAVRRVPGVEQAAWTSFLPLSDDSVLVGSYGAHFEQDPPGGGRGVYRYAVSPGYCATMHMPLRSGRCFGEGDEQGSPPVALISESLARSEFPGQSPIGKRLHLGPIDRPWFTVVGVVGDVKQTSLAANESDAVYLPFEQSWFADDAMSLVVRVRGDSAALTPAIRSAIWSVDPNQPIVREAAMDALVSQGEASRRFVLLLFEVFACAALALAGVGIFGILSGSVTERRREIGVRSALGETRSSIVRLVLRQGLLLAGAGALLGLCGAAAASPVVASLLFAISPLDPLTYLGATALLLAIAALACALPAGRAASVNPVEALRAE